MSNKKYWIVKGLKIATFATLAISLFTWTAMHLWNWLMPEIFGWSSIDIWQTLGLLALSRLFFGSWGRGGRGGWKKGRHQSHSWKSRMKDKWQNMDEDERKAFKEKMKSRCRTGNWDQWEREENGKEVATN